MEYFKHLHLWNVAGDIILTYLNEGYLNEVPISKYLDTFMEGEDAPVTAYHFETTGMEVLVGNGVKDKVEVRD